MNERTPAAHLCLRPKHRQLAAVMQSSAAVTNPKIGQITLAITFHYEVPIY